MSALPPSEGGKKIRPGFRGVIQQDIVRGTERSRAWPRKRGRSKDPEQIERQEWFRQVQWAFKMQAPQVQMTMNKMVEETPLLPRDLAMMLWSGRAYAFVWDNERIWWSMAAYRDVSLSLDVISSVVGHTLERGTDGWIGVPGGGGGGGGKVQAVATEAYGSVASSAFNLKANLLRSPFALRIEALMVRWNAVNTGTYYAAIAALDSGLSITEIIATSDPYVAGATATVTNWFELQADLIAGQLYAALFWRSDAAGNYVMPIHHGGTGSTYAWSGLPLEVLKSGRANNNNPIAGTTLTSDTATLCILPVGSIVG